MLVQDVLSIGGSKLIANLLGEKLFDTGLRNYLPFIFFPLFIAVNIEFSIINTMFLKFVS